MCVVSLRGDEWPFCLPENGQNYFLKATFVTIYMQPSDELIVTLCALRTQNAVLVEISFYIAYLY